MKNIIAKPTLTNFCTKHADADARNAVWTWFDFVKKADWHSPDDVRRDYGDDSVLNDRRAVFNIKGNDYRLVVDIHYKSQIVHIRFIGTHEEYNRIDALTV